MRTLRELVSSVTSMLAQTGDDAKISKAQIILWSTWFVNKYIYLQLTKIDTGSYITIIPNLTVQNSAVTQSRDVVKSRKYSILPTGVFDLDHDLGIMYITYPSDFVQDSYIHLKDIQFQRIRLEHMDKLKRNPYDKPEPGNPFFASHGKYIMYLGLDDILISTVEIGLRTPFDPFVEHSLDDPIPILNMYGDAIAKNVYEMGRYELLMPKDRANDGSATPDAGDVSKTRAVSVNENTEQ